MAGWADSFPCPTPVVAELGVYRDLAQRREYQRSDIRSRMLGRDVEGVQIGFASLGEWPRWFQSRLRGHY